MSGVVPPPEAGGSRAASLINRVVASSKLMDEALDYARRIAAKAPAAVAASKEMIGYARDHSVAESFAYLNALQPGVFSIEDIARAVAAQKGGPAPEFEDLPPIAPPIKP